MPGCVRPPAGRLRLLTRALPRERVEFHSEFQWADGEDTGAREEVQNVRGMAVLPHGVGKTARVAVFARGKDAEEALAAGADVVSASSRPCVCLSVNTARMRDTRASFLVVRAEGEPLAREPASLTDVLILSWPHNASTAP